MKPKKSAKKLQRDLETFEKLPAKTKDLHVLSDQAEKSVGKKRVAIQRKIEKKSQQ
jgi:hypothetical protein